MANKSFSIINEEDITFEENDQLVIEVAKSHLACVLTRGNEKSIAAAELFSIKEEEQKNFADFFNKVQAQSTILSLPTSTVHVYINNAFCIPVPIFKFNKEIAEDYLNVVFGEAGLANTQFEHLPIDPGIMNVYRIDQDCYQFFLQRYTRVHFHHSYSNLIKRITRVSSDRPYEHIRIQFYETFMIVAVMKNGQLQLIQSFQYETPEDVLYYLLQVTNQLEIFSPALTLQISGLIDLDFKLYRELITYFKDVIVEKEPESEVSLNLGEYPAHYFTPFFNLAV